MIGFVAYILACLGLQVGLYSAPIVAALILTVACLFLVSWLFISHTQADWVKTTQFIAVGLIFEGFVLSLSRATGNAGSIYFGTGTFIAGIFLLLLAKRH